MSRILHLNLHRKWFELIASGEKKEEYRNITPFWEKRLFVVNDEGQPKQYDAVRFRNGYNKNAPEVQVEWKGCWKGEGHPMLGAEPNKKYYVIWLGKILSIKNYENKL